jgi:hypothetical protein
VRPPAERAPLRFRADAKAEGEDVALGGWLCHPQGPKHSRWFAVRITRKSAPWAYWAGEAYKTIATLELFATLLCVMAFGPPEGAEGMICLSGDTDNKGNTFIVNRLMTTKFPVNVVLMELCLQLEARRTTLDLQWLPRDDNQEADDLSNFEFSKFDPEKRIHVELASLNFEILPELMDLGEGLYRDIEARKKNAKLAKAIHPSRNYLKQSRRKRSSRNLGGEWTHGVQVLEKRQRGDTSSGSWQRPGKKRKPEEKLKVAQPW